MDKEIIFEYTLKNKKFPYIQDKCMEEMAELIQAFFKARESGKELSVNIEEEFGDVHLMMEQVRYWYDSMTDGEFSRNVALYQQAKCSKLWSIWHEGDNKK